VTIEVKKLKKELVNDFYSLHCEKNGEGWCNCIAWWVPTWDNWDQRTKEQNREFRDQLFEKGEFDGYLLYIDGAVVGWSQCGARDRLVKLRSQFSLPPDPSVYAITCFVIAPKFRKQGLAHKLLSAILEDLKDRGVQRVQAYPKRGAGLKDGSVWMGPEALYLRAGFSILQDGEHTAILERTL
jgi:GNAT superfamily N-acetyltransferase